ncbi:ABC-type branched-chain amino acid transport system, substrate-binding protein [Pustulibacterium marinum]|uniref:ABC-type branched-chain amino acid transport system, substrate-binding protein n=1 Tax=Pustulibacterium marinum TaxID=1224947 RepID=A0A1I7G685_9FLAO|nr:LysM peptidoglycan-binding domain-containing protein [Pustulibacterium marinum]SFU43944.1 ABC-type branched-chain amino acid transport system, substrate-binding protein [Pustulibacterium marinum]
MNKIIASFLGIFLFTVISVNAQGYKSHTVQKGETIESIAKKYNIEPYDIYKFNPGAQKGIHENSVLIIPSKSIQPKATGSDSESVTFVEHKVKRKETLFGISQEYKVAIEDIKKYNPELYSRELDKGEKIKIPIIKNKPVQETPIKKIDSSKTQKLKPYVVQKSEGLFRVATNHGITVEALKELNPNMKASLQLGDTLWVPVVEAEQEVIANEYDFYTVKPAEGFFSIEKNSGYTQEVIERLNPEVKLTGLKPGMVLKLPRKKTDSLPFFHNFIKASHTNLVDSIRLHDVSMALVLPFKAGELTVDSVPQLVKKLRSDKVLNISLDIYSGVLKAVDSLKNLGVNVHLKVLDSQGDEYVIDQLTSKGEFNGVQAIIGPLYTKNFNKLASNVMFDSIPLFAPLSNKNLKDYSNIFSTVPNDNDLSDALLSYVKKRESNYHVIIFADEEHTVSKNKLKALFPNATVASKETFTVKGIDALLSKTQRNLVFAETNHVPTLTNITNILNTLATESLHVQLATTNKTDAFDSDAVRNEYLNKLHFLYPTIDKPSSLNLPFAKSYYEQYQKYPSKFAVRGFDLTMDTALRLAQGEPLSKNTLFIGETAYIENKFHYIKQPYGNYFNNAVYVVMYKDMEIVEAP